MVHVLTGAGFSANVGAPLAKDVSDQVFSILSARGNERAARLIREKGGFEQACAALDQMDADLLVIKEAVVDVFNALDECHRSLMPGHQPNLHLGARVWHMMRILSVAGVQGSVFTTNFDMLVERYWHSGGIKSHRVQRPLLQESNKWFSGEASNAYRPSEHFSFRKDAKIDGGSNYIKLHGSLDWTDSGPNPVIGTTKRAEIRNHSILSRYWDYLINRLQDNGAKLLVVGYGFGDEYLNEVIDGGVRAGQLKLFIWDTRPYDDMMAHLSGINALLPDAVAGYCCQRIADRFVVIEKHSDPWYIVAPDLRAFIER